MNGKRHLALHRLTVSKRGDKLRGSEILESSVAEPQKRRLFRFHLDLLEITGRIHGQGEFDDTVRFHGKILGIMGPDKFRSPAEKRLRTDEIAFLLQLFRFLIGKNPES